MYVVLSGTSLWNIKGVVEVSETIPVFGNDSEMVSDGDFY